MINECIGCRVSPSCFRLSVRLNVVLLVTNWTRNTLESPVCPTSVISRSSESLRMTIPLTDKEGSSWCYIPARKDHANHIKNGMYEQ